MLTKWITNISLQSFIFPCANLCFSLISQNYLMKDNQRGRQHQKKTTWSEDELKKRGPHRKTNMQKKYLYNAKPQI